MIGSLTNPNHGKWWTLFHLAFGVVAIAGSIPVILWFHASLIGIFYLLSFSAINRTKLLVAAMAYLGGFELMARMTSSSPFIPWEASKYLFLILCVIGYIITTRRPPAKLIGWAIILLCTPGLFIDKSGDVDEKQVIFNILGVINIGLGILFFGSVRINREELKDLMHLLSYPCLSALAYTIFKTPDFKEIQFTLTAKMATSGDFGSNQVSTVLGLGFMLFAIAYLMNWRFSGERIVDGFLALAFLVQGLLTFSRGGMVSAALAVAVFVYYMSKGGVRHSNIKADLRNMVVPLFIFIIGAIVYVNEKTGGNLFLRYQGETYGTMLGTRDKDLATLTSNRTVVFMDDLELWGRYPVLGVGIGASKHMRDEGHGIAAHIELSRLLAEQGLPGLIIFIMICAFGVRCLKEPDPVIKAIKCAMFVLAILTTFHSATRTFITPLLLSLCALQVSDPPPTNDPVPGE